jgi:hypothetical protein
MTSGSILTKVAVVIYLTWRFVQIVGWIVT